ncbi:MAG: M23 family metallopeptidase [Yonghaparkia sp.]|nr:M23 family metallopeptidase [Microcella sp.]
MGRAIASKGFPALVMASVAMLLVGTTVPANALFDPESTPASLAFSSLPSTEAATTAEQLDVEAQAIEGEMSEDLATAAASRDEWGVTSYAEMLRLRYGSTNYAYTASGSGAIRWPFPFAAPITSAFGERAAPCYGCPTYHRGLDFDAGYGAPVGAIADGIVIAVGRSAAYGYRVEIEHVINGQKVMSMYAHMIDNSSVLAVGDTVVAGEIVGAVGSTGLSTGPHLHLEIHVDDVAIDPFAWLKANAG